METKEALALSLVSDEICHSDVLLYKEWTCDAGKDVLHDGAEDKVLGTKGSLKRHLPIWKFYAFLCLG